MIWIKLPLWFVDRISGYHQGFVQALLMLAILHKRWWTLSRTLPVLVLTAGTVVIIVNYYTSMQYVESILPSVDTSVPADYMRRHVRQLALISALLVIVVAILFWYALRRLVAEPVSRLARTSRVLKTGNYSVSAHLKQVNELGDISTALDTLAIKAQDGEDISSLNARLIDIVEHSANEVYVADATTYRILSANLAARQKHGLDAAKLSQWYPWSFMPQINRDVLKEQLKPLQNGVGATQVFDTELVDLQGVSYEVEVTLQLLNRTPPPVILMIAKDIQAFSQQYRDLQLRNKAMDALDVGITITDARQSGYPLVYVNEGWCRISGYDAHEMLGRPVRELQRSEGNQTAHKKIEQAQQQGKSVQVLLKSTRKDGSHFMDELSLSPVRDSTGALTHYIGVNRDVTKRLETQRQLENVQRLESVGLLSGGIAHDFNNLLAVIQGNLEFLSPMLTDAEQRDLLAEATNATNMGARLTKRLLTFARRSQLESATLDVNTLVLEAVELLRSAVGESIILSTSLAVDLWPIHSDQSQVENAIVNLTINARDAIHGSGEIVIETANETHVDVTSGQSPNLPAGDYVRLTVTDNGSGMTPEVRSRVLEPFYTTKSSGGSGLGLSTIYGFIRQTGGELRIDTEPGVGTSVALYFPRQLDPARNTDVESRSVISTCPSDNRKVLVVEDNVSVRRVTVGRLNALGYSVEEAARDDDARELMTRAVEAGSPYDLVLTDVVMDTDSSGFQLARWVGEFCPGCAVILTSAYSDKRPQDSLHRVFLQKPYSIEQLREALSACFADSE